MGLFGFLKPKKVQDADSCAAVKVDGNAGCHSVKEEYADSCSIAPDERAYYRPDDYYTTYSFPGTEMARRVVPFEERKKISYPSARGLYVAEILLLEYCNYGKYPKPSRGYPGFWWFEYGIRDIGHALESLENRGFLQWVSPERCLSSLRVDDLKHILNRAGLSTTGKKADLVKRILGELPKEQIGLPNSAYKYELTDLGKMELLQNGYVPYMHKHPNKTAEDVRFGEVFNVWSVNKLFPNGDASDWRSIIGQIEKKLFGIDMATAIHEQGEPKKQTIKDCDITADRSAIRAYLAEQRNYINQHIRTSGDGYAEESKGLDLVRAGKDKDALVQFYISIGKKFDAPALYRETAILLEKYGMFDEELYVIDKGLKVIPQSSRHFDDLSRRRDRIQKKVEK